MGPLLTFNVSFHHFYHSGSTTVAVKMLKANASESEKRDLLQELAIMKLLEPHPNVVRLLGCCTEKGISYDISKLFFSCRE